MFLFTPITAPSDGITNPGGGITQVARIFDGSATSVATITSDGARAQVDFTKNVNIGAIRIKTIANSALSSIRIRTSTNGTTFSDPATIQIGNSEWHFGNFTARNRRYLELTFNGGTGIAIGSVELYEIEGNYGDNLSDYTLRHYEPGRASYQRHDGVLVVNPGDRIETDLVFSFQRLPQSDVDALRTIFESDNVYTIMPDTVEPDRIYHKCRWISDFAFQDAGQNWNLGQDGEVTFTANLGIRKPAIKVEIDGVNVTDRLVVGDSLRYSEQTDYPRLLEFTSGSLQFTLDNSDGDFDYNQSSNFFSRRDEPVHGRGVSVTLWLGASTSDLQVVFAGQILRIQTSLRDTRASIVAADLSQLVRDFTIENFGTSITRKITDFEGVNREYSEFNPVFYFPNWALPISKDSVSLTVDGTAITVVDTVNFDGVLSNTRAEIDYQRGLIRFEAPPSKGEAAVIEATWKQDYRYKRPDTLVRLLLEHADFDDKVSLTVAQMAYALKSTLIRVSSDQFSSHGRPNFEQLGVTRWLGQNPITKKWYFAQENYLAEYDEELDSWTQLATIADDTTVTAIPPGQYGSRDSDEDVSLTVPVQMIDGQPQYPFVEGVAFGEDKTYVLASVDLNNDPLSPRFQNSVHRYSGTGAFESAIATIGTEGTGFNRFSTATVTSTQAWDIAIYNDKIYFIQYYARATGNGTGQFTSAEIKYRVLSIPIAGGATTTVVDNIERIQYSNSEGVPSQRGERRWITVSPDLIFVTKIDGSTTTYNHSGVQQSTFDLGDQIRGIAVDSSYLYAAVSGTGQTQRIAVFTHTGTAVATRNILVPTNIIAATLQALAIDGTTLYVGRSVSNTSSKTYYAYDTSNPGNYHEFGIIDVATLDYETFYVLATNTLKGDITTDSAFNRNRIMKYVRSTNTWTILLSNTKGQPQIAQEIDLITERAIIGDNRKTFEVIRRSNKTLIFYRRFNNTTASVSVYNETDDTFIDIHSETASSTNGVAYSMDFCTDIRNDGIYVYSFVIKRVLSGSSFTSATLKIFRRRIQPNLAEVEIYTATFTGTSGVDEYPINVSDLILADDRNKFYFVLDYYSESDTMHGKSELSTIAKAGTGSRTVIKTYPFPVTGPRSPLKQGSSYYYLEGNWYRNMTVNLYPDTGGHLIEVTSANGTTDKGIVWRSASKLDSPDPANSIYDGWGLHNAITTNLTADDRGNLHFVAGFGAPYAIDNNLPSVATQDPIEYVDNFVWLQYGQDLATKIRQFPTEGRDAWELIVNLATLINYEVGFGPSAREVSAFKTANSSATDWEANAVPFFRPRTVQPAKLRSTITATGTSVSLNNSDTPAEHSEFPAPASGESHLILIGSELIRYTGATTDTNGVVLSGVTRGQHGSMAAAHTANVDVYFVDLFLTGGTAGELIVVDNRQLDTIQLKNEIRVPFGNQIHIATDDTSITANGKKSLTLSNQELSRNDASWAAWLGESYLDRFGEADEVITCTIRYTPALSLGQLIVFHQTDRIQVQYKPFTVLSIIHDAVTFRTTITMRAI